MTTARDVVTQALRRLRLISLGEDAPAEEMAVGVSALNELIASWKGRGVDLMMAPLAGGDTVRFFVPPQSLTAQVRAGLSDQGTWDADTNSPTLASSVGTAGYFYRVSVAGSTTLNDVTSWLADDYAVFDGCEWLKGQAFAMHMRGIAALLAVDLAGQFGKPIDGSLASAASDGWSSLQADFIKPIENSFDRGIVDVTSRRYVGWLN